MTPAINILKKNKCNFNVHKYDHDPACTNYGQEAALKLNVQSNAIFKTLLCELNSKELVVAIIPVDCSLSLKCVASSFNAKSAQMADKIQAQKVTGYLLGGISPLGQKKRLRTVLHESAKALTSIYVSGGKRGLDIEVHPDTLLELLDASYNKITS